MNCRPGDLAFIKRCRDQPVLAGRLVNVLVFVEQASRYLLPCGDLHGPVNNRWLCELIGAPGPAKTRWGTEPSNYFFIPDSVLLPIRDPGDDAIDQFARQQEVAR